MRQVTIQCRTCDLWNLLRRDGRNVESTRPKGQPAHARFVLFLSSPLTRNLGHGRGLLLREQYVQGLAKGPEGVPHAKFTT